MRGNAFVQRLFGVCILLLLGQSCESPGPDPLLPIWGVWNPGKANEGPYRNVETEMGLFKSPSDNPVIIQPQTKWGPSISVQGQLLLIQEVLGEFPEYLVKVREHLGDKGTVGTLRLKFKNLDELTFEKVDGDYFILHPSVTSYTRAEKLSSPIDETEYNNGS